MLSELNTADSPPKKGDLIVIMTKKSRTKIAAVVKDVVNGNEIILQKSTNSFFIWDMYQSGESWVWRVWNIGSDITPTTSLNNTNQLLDF